jgi:hypothetical protein
MIEVAILLGCAFAMVAVVVFAISSLSERMNQKEPKQPVNEDVGDPQPLEF